VHGHSLLTDLVLLVAMAAAGVALFERLRLPAIAGFLVTGAVLGPGGLGLVSDPEAVQALAELGVVFLLFEIGLEIPVDRLRRRGAFTLAAGGLQLAGTLVVAAGAAWALGLPGPTAFVIGALVAMSSTALVIRLLSERGELDAPHGQIAVGILLFQDLCIVPFLVAVPLLAGEAVHSGWPVARALLRAGLALLLFLGVARFALPWVLDRAARLRSRDLFSLVSVLVVAGAAVGAESAGLTLAVGAFLAGLAASSTPYGHQLFAEVLPLRGVLLGVFFTAVGMLLDVRTAAENPSAVLLFAAGAVPLKAAVVLAVLALALRQSPRVSVLAALALAQTGEFSFVLASAAAASGVLDSGLQQAVIAGSILSLLATPFLVRVAPTLAARLDRAARGRAGEEGPETLTDHVLLIGYGLTGRSVARVLRAIEQRVLAVEANAQTVHEARAAGEDIVYGDALRAGLLERVGIRGARALVVAITDPLATRQVVTLARSLHPALPIVARTRYVLDVDPLSEAGADVVVAEEVEATLDVVSQTLRIFGIPSGAIARFVAELREEGYELLRPRPALALDPWLGELLEQVSTEWLEVGMSVAGEPTLLELAFRERTGASVLAIERGGRTIPNPTPSESIRAGDRLLVFGGTEALGRAHALLVGLAAPRSGERGYTAGADARGTVGEDSRGTVGEDPRSPARADPQKEGG
jgi:CPA2 family monovalent cation:H+ antiporter-2